MKINSQNFRAFFYACVLFLWFFTSCKKSEKIPDFEFEVPAQFSLTYGSDTTIHLFADHDLPSNVHVKVGFEDTPSINIRHNRTLQDQLEEAITWDAKTRLLKIQSAKLYPNRARSVLSLESIPSHYKINLIAESSNGQVWKKESLIFQVKPAVVAFKQVNHSDNHPYAYRLYSDKPTILELDSAKLPIKASALTLANTSVLKAPISLVQNHFVFAAESGDLGALPEKSYDLEPILLMDGYPVASSPLKVTFIPQIKFFYGTYYPDLNISVKTPVLFIGLTKGYLSPAPVLHPENYKGKFEIQKIELDGQVFVDKDQIFGVQAASGRLMTKVNQSLKAGSYKITIKGTLVNGMELFTVLTLHMNDN